MATKTAKHREKRKPKGKAKATRIEQQYIGDMAPEKNKKVHPLALEFLERSDDYKAAKKKVDDAHDELFYAMQDEGLEIYKYETIMVRISVDKKAKAKRIPPETVSANGDAVSA